MNNAPCWPLVCIVWTNTPCCQHWPYFSKNAADSACFYCFVLFFTVIAIQSYRIYTGHFPEVDLINEVLSRNFECKELFKMRKTETEKLGRIKNKYPIFLLLLEVISVYIFLIIRIRIKTWIFGRNKLIPIWAVCPVIQSINTSDYNKSMSTLKSHHTSSAGWCCCLCSKQLCSVCPLFAKPNSPSISLFIFLLEAHTSQVLPSSYSFWFILFSTSSGYSSWSW